MAGAITLIYRFKLVKMKQELINLIEELRHTANMVAHTFTREIAHNDMNTEQWELLQDGLKEINLKSQEAFLISANLRREEK